MTVKEMVMNAANRGEYGGFANTDGDWCATRNASEFKSFLQKHGFTVTKCRETAHSTAIAETEEGFSIAWNGYCRKIQ